MLKIGKPRIEDAAGGKARLVSDIEVDGAVRTVWAEVSGEYRDYLCHERSDAFLIGFLHWAMRHGHDIECEAPVGEYLLYQVTTLLIPSVAEGSPRMHAMRIHAAADTSRLPSAGAVGTGISCGIDSLHVLAGHTGDAVPPRHRLTHLAFNNVGSHGEGEHAKHLYAERRRRAAAFCAEYGFKLTEVDSNIMDEFEQNHYLTHTYSSMFAVFALQKLYSVYYYASSGHTLLEFSLKDNDLDGPALYELLLLYCFSTETLRVYTEGASQTRQGKVRRVADYAPSYKYLNVCLVSDDNCSRCEKCTRTLLALDALGRLDDYRAVFDVDYYRAHRADYLVTLTWKKWAGNAVYVELWPSFKGKVGLVTRLRALPHYAKWLLVHRLPQGRLLTLARRVYRRLRGRGGS